MKPVLRLAAAAALVSCSAASAYPPRPAGPVLDQADVLPATDEAALADRLTKFYNTTGDALVVVTVESLEYQSVEQYANGLYNAWNIGDAKTDRGVLILLAPNERSARIEVGCGLESTVTDGFASQVMETKMIPEYKQNHFEAGTLAGVDAIIERLRSTPANDNRPVSAACQAQLVKAQ